MKLLFSSKHEIQIQSTWTNKWSHLFFSFSFLSLSSVPYIQTWEIFFSQTILFCYQDFPRKCYFNIERMKVKKKHTVNLLRFLLFYPFLYACTAFSHICEAFKDFHSYNKGLIDEDKLCFIRCLNWN